MLILHHFTYCENLIDEPLSRIELCCTRTTLAGSAVLVSEKTAELSQEKRRSEEVLPRPQLAAIMLGELVKPEQFECVIIYLSPLRQEHNHACRWSPLETPIW